MTASGSLPAAAGHRVRDVLAGPERVARVLHRGPDALYLEVDGWCLGLVSRSATAVPCALVLPREHLGRLSETATAQVGSGRLRLWTASGERSEVHAARLLDVSVPVLATSPASYVVERMRAHAAVAVAELAGVLASPCVVAAGHGSREGPGMETISDLRLVGSRLPMADLLGRGSGLTPLGDDVICGWLATGHARGVPESSGLDPRDRTTLFSATLIDCAGRGEVLPEFAELVRALAGADIATIEGAAATLAGVGHTSGAGLLLGACLRFAAEACSDARSRCA